MKKTHIVLFFLIFNLVFGQKDSLIYKNENGLEIYNTKAVYKNNEIYNSKKERQEELIKNEEIDNCPVVIHIYRNPLSLIGNYFSYEYFFGSEAACGPYGNSICVETVDLQTVQKISLSDLFTEESIVSALKNDYWVKEHFEDNLLETIESFEQILNLLNSYEYDFRFTPSGFAFINRKIEDGKIAVRLVGSQALSVSYHRVHLQLGLLLEPKPSFKKVFLNETEFILGDYKNGLTN